MVKPRAKPRPSEPGIHAGSRSLKSARPRKPSGRFVAGLRTGPDPKAVVSEPAPEHLAKLATQISVCTRCPLCQSRTLAVPGEGKPEARVMIIGEGPGAKEDKTGRPFVGSAGKYLDHILAGTRFTRADFFITNIVKCRPPGNRSPRSEEVKICTSLYLFEQMKLLNPRLVLLLGSVAVNRLLRLKSVEEARGKVIDKEGRRFLATYHLAVRFYRADLAQKIKEDFALLTKELANL